MLILALCILSVVQGLIVQRGNPAESAIQPETVYENALRRNSFQRQKRQITYLQRLGNLALKRILKDAKDFPRNNAKQLYYYKRGDWAKAEQEFFSLKPVDVRRPKGGYYNKSGQVIFGRVGDRRIRLVEKDSYSGEPSIEFTKEDVTSLPYKDKIFYKSKEFFSPGKL